MKHYSFLNSQSHFLVAFLPLKDMERVTFYVDGFNFYYGLRTKKKVDAKWKQAYWINLVQLFSQFLGKEQVLDRVIYFTASPLNAEKSSRQSAFLNANKIINGDKFEIVRGKYLCKIINCPNCQYAITKPEEKKTDVNISVRMIADCIEDKTDKLVLVSGDSDLVPPIDYILNRYTNKSITVYFPPTIHSSNLSQIMRCNKSKVIYLEKNFIKFQNSIMPDNVSLNGKIFTKPNKWK